MRELTIPTVLYGRRDLTSVSVTQADGTEHRHALKVETVDKREVTVLKCKACIERMIKADPAIVTPTKDPNVTFSTHWAPTARLVQKTEDEIQKEMDDQAAFAAASGQQYADFLRFQQEQKQRKGGINF
jgi:hypothetical protein